MRDLKARQGHERRCAEREEEVEEEEDDVLDDYLESSGDEGGGGYMSDVSDDSLADDVGGMRIAR